MATIKAIEARSVHQIQSGQVIVDLCSSIKELVENSLDAGATSIEVRFKNHGLDSVEVQDNGDGIAAEDYDTIALKHHTSKLSTYSDLNCLNTFGFRGEALSSLCAVADFHIVTARADAVPKGTRIDFESSGKPKGTKVVASTKGTTVSVENLFFNLPVRRRELEKNVKREYGKALSLLHAYGCISTGSKFSVTNQPSKGKKAVVFTTKNNPTTRENISNIFGAKSLSGLVEMNLRFELEPTHIESRRKWTNQEDQGSREVNIIGYVSRPVFGEGRQAPDRQMFFVNGRPCGLPQVSKAFNEVYRSFNIAQSPFVFADLRMDTNSYDVNVSPDKRTIFLHEQSALLESLKASLSELFENQDQTVPSSSILPQRTPIRPHSSREDDIRKKAGMSDTNIHATSIPTSSQSEQAEQARGDTKESSQISSSTLVRPESSKSKQASQSESLESSRPIRRLLGGEGVDELAEEQKTQTQSSNGSSSEHVVSQDTQIPVISSHPYQGSQNHIQNAFDRMRPRRAPPDTAVITIGSKTTTSPIGTPVGRREKKARSPDAGSRPSRSHASNDRANSRFAKSLRNFSASGTADPTHAEHHLDVERDSQEESTADSEKGGSPGTQESRQSLRSFEPRAELPGSGSDRLPDNAGDESSESEYVDESQRREEDLARVDQLIEKAQQGASKSESQSFSRARHFGLEDSLGDESTCRWYLNVNTSIAEIVDSNQLLKNSSASGNDLEHGKNGKQRAVETVQTPEERLSLTVAKEDFERMSVVGQFNLGFILATRPTRSENRSDDEELFIIDQHASDEKFNFERLQAETVVQNQRLVKPQRLELTAVEEEIIIDNTESLIRNGFIVDVDESGDEAIGQRCSLVSLPMSREVVFDHRDLEELITLLSETSGSTHMSMPRPSKVRRMFAMRACRSSIMIGRTLTMKQMRQVVRHMGSMEKPWNCPHGRPTMRHMAALKDWDSWQDSQHRAPDWSSFLS